MGLRYFRDQIPPPIDDPDTLLVITPGTKKNGDPITLSFVRLYFPLYALSSSSTGWPQYIDEVARIDDRKLSCLNVNSCPFSVSVAYVAELEGRFCDYHKYLRQSKGLRDYIYNSWGSKESQEMYFTLNAIYIKGIEESRLLCKIEEGMKQIRRDGLTPPPGLEDEVDLE